MLVSVIVPVYNSQKYIYQCLYSLLKQSYNNLELIVVNDGSTDNTKIIIEELMLVDPRIALINKENGGASSARNTGIVESKGEFLVFVDSDDTVTENYILDFILDLEKNKDSDIIIHGFEIVDLDNVIKIVEPLKEALICSGDNTILQKIPFLCLSSPISKFFKREIVFNNKLKFDESINIGEDLVFVMDYLADSSIVYVSDKHNYKYERRNGSLSTSLHSFDEELLADKLIFKSCEKMLLKQGVDLNEFRDIIELALNKHGYRIIFSLYNKGLSHYSRELRIKNLKQINDLHFSRIRRYFFNSSIKGKLISFLLNKKIINISDYFLLFLIQRKNYN